MMAKKVVGLAVLWSVIFCLFSGAVFATGSYHDGDGSAEFPYEIAEPNQLIYMNQHPEHWGLNFLLTADLNLNLADPNTFTTAVIAPDISSSMYYQGTPFTGVFDGSDHIISNLTINTAGAGNDYLGLFGKIEGSGAEVKNLGLENVNITGGDNSIYLGGLFGDNRYGTISNCYTTGSVTGGDSSHGLGGLCGYNREGTISNCYATGSVIGGDDSNYLGGLCGGNLNEGTPGIRNRLRNCYSAVSVTGDNHLGGLVGFNSGYISNCYATGSVSGDDYLGGLSGRNFGSISNCYSTGPVTGGTGSSYLGGLCGSNDYGSINVCYFLSIAGPDNGLGEPLDDPNMMIQSSFVGWDFVIVWCIDEGRDYPRLQPSHEPTYPGNGTPEDPYQISTVEQLNDLGRFHPHWDKHFILTADIDLAGVPYTTAVIAPDISPYDIRDNYMFQGTSFTGVFDGNDHFISNLTIDDAGTGHDHLGLFGKIEGSGAEVKNLGLESVNITGGDNSRNLGGLCGYNREGTISNCYASGSVTGGDNSRDLGGLCGYNREGTISNCYASGSVIGGNDSLTLGGLCGYNRDSSISNCYSTSSVISGDGISGILGGLCGLNTGVIINSYATGLVTGGDDSRHLGGLCGYSEYSEYIQSFISNCYSTGSVTGGAGSSYLGGLCGSNYWYIRNCYSIGSVTGGAGSSNLGGLFGHSTLNSVSYCYFLDTAGPDNGYGTPLTDSAMKQQNSFTDWDFVGEEDNGIEDIWQLCIDGYDYPRLTWQFNPPADFLHPGRVDHYDLFVFTQDWLSANSRCCNINPPDGDDIVNLLDYTEFTKYWLVE